MYSVGAWPSSYDHRPWHPYYAGTEHVGCSPTRQGGDTWIRNIILFMTAPTVGENIILGVRYIFFQRQKKG